MHPTKTRLVCLRPPRAEAPLRERAFHFLGFTHYWGRSRGGGWVIQRKTAKERFARALRAVGDRCRRMRHLPLPAQYVGLSRRLRGHYAYFGITGNVRSLGRFHRLVVRVWAKWLARRSGRRRLNWEKAGRLLARYRLPTPRLVHAFL